MSKLRAAIVAMALVAASGFVAATPASAHSGTHRYGPWHNANEKTYWKAIATIDLALHTSGGYICGSIRASGSYWVFSCHR